MTSPGTKKAVYRMLVVDLDVVLQHMAEDQQVQHRRQHGRRPPSGSPPSRTAALPCGTGYGQPASISRASTVDVEDGKGVGPVRRLPLHDLQETRPPGRPGRISTGPPPRTPGSRAAGPGTASTSSALSAGLELGHTPGHPRPRQPVQPARLPVGLEAQSIVLARPASSAEVRSSATTRPCLSIAMRPHSASASSR
jgi:hypothetical protein